jgi:cell division control protein 6
VFKDREALRHDYIPERLPHREAQIRWLGEILAPTLRGHRCSNLFIYGQTGTGKTAAVRHILVRLLRKSKEVGAPLDTCYVNCRVAGTDYRVMFTLCQAVGVDVPFTGLALAEVFERFKVALEAKRQVMIVILDEVDALVKVQGDLLLYDLTRVNESLRLSRVSLIGISNDLRFKELLDPRVLSSLSEEEVVFSPYSAPELKDILLERVNISFIDSAVSEGALNLCCALAAAEHGDARRALDLLRVAGELAEREGRNVVSEAHVRLAEKKIEEDRVVEVLRTLPVHSKLVMCSVNLLHGVGAEASITGDIFMVYCELCERLSLDALTQRRVSGLVNELDILGLLNARVVSLGRYGRTKKVSLGVPSTKVREVYTEDSWIGHLVGYTPKCLIDHKKS